MTGTASVGVPCPVRSYGGDNEASGAKAAEADGVRVSAGTAAEEPSEVPLIETSEVPLIGGVPDSRLAFFRLRFAGECGREEVSR